MQTLEAYLRDRISPNANLLDHSHAALKQAFLELGQQQWLGLKIPVEWGGMGLRSQEFQELQEMFARYSGALAFLQAQHQSAGGFLSRCDNDSLKQAYLPHMATGAIAVGVGFSHLRRPIPSLKALPVPKGFCLEGTIPWITGFGIFQAFVGAAVLPDGQAVYGMLPFCHTHPASGGFIQFSEPMQLAAMTSTNTVTAELQQWFLPSDRVLFINPAEAIHGSDRHNVLQHSFYALGCARAGLDLLGQIGQERSQDFILEAHHTLNQELNSCREGIYTAAERSVAERLQLRARAIELAVRCAHAAVIASGGAANSLHHPAQRIYREAMVFSVTGQTSAVMQAALQKLTENHAQKYSVGQNF